MSKAAGAVTAFMGLVIILLGFWVMGKDVPAAWLLIGAGALAVAGGILTVLEDEE